MKTLNQANKIFGILILIGLVVSVAGLTFPLPGEFAQAAVTRDASTVKVFNNASSVLWTHTTNGNDRLLIVGASYYNFGGGRTVSSVTYGGISLTKLTSFRQNNVTAELWYLTAPLVGSNNVKITIAGGTSSGVVGATSWTGVDQTMPLGIPSSIGGNNSTLALTVTSTQGEVIQDILVWDREVTSPPNIIEADQIQLWSGISWYVGGASSQEARAGSVTMSWGLSKPTDWALIAVPIKPLITVPDTVPPIRSNGSPSGTLPSGTTSTTLSLTTNENASCRYSNIAGTAFTAMTNMFSITGSTNHSTTISGLNNGNNYSFYVRCQDTAGNANSDDFAITFTVNNVAGSGPTLSTVSLTKIPLGLNTTITFTGNAFQAGAVILLQGVQTIEIAAQYISSTQLQWASAPQVAVGPYTASVKNPDGKISGGVPITFTDLFTEVQQKKSILIMIAHPDDEVIVGNALLSRTCKALGSRCTVLSMTNGNNAARAKEFNNFGLVMNFKPIMKNFADGSQGTTISGDPNKVIQNWNQQEDVRAYVLSVIRQENPDILITLEPTHGMYGHPDHRAIAMLTEEAWRNNPDILATLYYSINRYNVPSLWGTNLDPLPVTDTIDGLELSSILGMTYWQHFVNGVMEAYQNEDAIIFAREVSDPEKKTFMRVVGAR